MAKSTPKLQGDLETDAMKEVWQRGRATVHEVRDAFKKRRKKYAYTTILNTLRNLERKGLLRHEKDGLSYVYIPVVDRMTVSHSSAVELVNRLFEGSLAHLLNALFKDETPTKKQFEALRQEIQDLRAGKTKSDG